MKIQSLFPPASRTSTISHPDISSCFKLTQHITLVLNVCPPKRRSLCNFWQSRNSVSNKALKQGKAQQELLEMLHRAPVSLTWTSPVSQKTDFWFLTKCSSSKKKNSKTQTKNQNKQTKTQTKTNHLTKPKPTNQT